jgi:hypothetical protein
VPRLIKHLIGKLGSRSQAYALAVRVRSFVIDGLSEDRALILTQNVRGRDAGCFATLDLSEANRWIYGDGAFGLRLAAWIARKAPDVPVDTPTLLMFRLREVPGAILPSNEIAEMAPRARKVCLFSKRHERCWRNDSRFSKILDPKRIKLAFADEIALKQWQRELNAINPSGDGKTADGSQ